MRRHHVTAIAMEQWLETQETIYAFGEISGHKMQMVYLPSDERWQIKRDGEHVAYFHKDLYETAAEIYNNAGYDVDND